MEWADPLHPFPALFVAIFSAIRDFRVSLRTIQVKLVQKEETSIYEAWKFPWPKIWKPAEIQEVENFTAQLSADERKLKNCGIKWNRARKI